MPELWLIKTANFLQVCVPALSLCGYLPQWRKLWRTRSAQDFSLRTWLIWLLASSFACFYALIQWRINDQVWPLLVSTTATWLCVIATLALIWRYRRR
ncbi:PQ-loop repeat-containing protein [Chitinibacter sp. SCUT-21]|uniref:PQ-loop domain-containing transporter n=1 Tax=Chitinibacter sp. SCUT-21 TaxID=2970891 RepID=UPI0035A72228